MQIQQRVIGMLQVNPIQQNVSPAPAQPTAPAPYDNAPPVYDQNFVRGPVYRNGGTRGGGRGGSNNVWTIRGRGGPRGGSGGGSGGRGGGNNVNGSNGNTNDSNQTVPLKFNLIVLMVQPVSIRMLQVLISPVKIIHKTIVLCLVVVDNVSMEVRVEVDMV